MATLEAEVGLNPATQYRLRAALGAIRDDELREGVLNLFMQAHRLASSGEITLCVLSARRLACLYLLLLEAGLPEIPCEVVSDRCIEMMSADRERAGGILLLDDAVVLGSTLYSLHGRLKLLVKAGQPVIVKAVCVDEEQVARFLLDEIGADIGFSRSTLDARRFSLDIAKTLFQGLTPYFADFPITRSFTFPGDALTRLLGSRNWYCADVTSRLLATPDQASYSLLPRDKIRRSMKDMLPAEIGAFTEILKIRLFVKRRAFEADLVIVPIATLAPMLLDQLNTAVKALQVWADRDGVDFPDFVEWSAEAKHRWLQMHLSALLLGHFRLDAEEHGLSTGSPITSSDLHGGSVAIHFGEDKREKALATFDWALSIPSGPVVKANSKVSSGSTLIPPVATSRVMKESALLDRIKLGRQLTSMFTLPTLPAPGELLIAGDDFVQSIASVFGFIERHYEEPERTEIRREGRVSSNFETRWFNEGLTLRSLQEVVFAEGSPSNPFALDLVSVAIDVCNDLGVAVPTTRLTSDRNTVYRSYRLGENAFLSSLRIEQLHRAAVRNLKNDDPSVSPSDRARILKPETRLVPRLSSQCRKVGSVPAPESTTGHGLASDEAVSVLLKELSTGPHPYLKK